MFSKADLLLFKDKDYHSAESIYRQILLLDPANIDAINSLAYCIRFRLQSSPTTTTTTTMLFDNLTPLYSQILVLDRADIEANFNMGLLYLEHRGDLHKAAEFFLEVVKTSKQGYSAQVGKSLYNLGMIYDRLGEIAKASEFYKQCLEQCEGEGEVGVYSTQYRKAVTNYGVTLEKLGRREEATEVIRRNKENGDVRAMNNMGIIEKRKGNNGEAEGCYLEALKMDKDNFFPNYNLGVLKFSDPSLDPETL